MPKLSTELEQAEQAVEVAPPAAAPAHDVPSRVIALQRTAGNRAVTQLLQREEKTVSIGDEKVIVKTDAEETEAKRIIKDLTDKYGVEVSSLKSIKALKSRAGAS